MNCTEFAVNLGVRSFLFEALDGKLRKNRHKLG